MFQLQVITQCRVLLNTAKSTREQIYLKIQGFQQQGSKFIYKCKNFNNKGTQEANLFDIN